MSIGSTIKKLRRDRDMTQEQLADHLGITANAVSQWECDRTAPDISQLPILAGLFSVTIDTLLEYDCDAQKEDIENFFRMIREELPNDDMETRIRLGKEYIAKYPKNYDIAHEMCWIIYWSDKTVRREYLPLLRSLCEKIIAECTVQTYREAAIELMCTLGNDQDWERWSKMCARDYKTYRGEILEKRLLEQEKYDECVLRKGANKLEYFCHLLNSNCGNRNASEESLAWINYRIDMIRSFGEGGEIPKAWQGYYAVMLTYKADRLFRLERDDEGYRNLEDAYGNFEKWTAIPDGTELCVGHEWLFHGVKVLKNKWNYRLSDGKDEYSNYMSVFTDQSDYLNTAMKMSNNWNGFERVRNEERYQEILRKAESLVNESK
ncbi:MAG: helix-turn-helix transcriptional regulator [Clostridia bacterium]|nr:helix-turn-helix transcriptional regulator [Clostridia bacterium]